MILIFLIISSTSGKYDNYFRTIVIYSNTQDDYNSDNNTNDNNNNNDNDNADDILFLVSFFNRFLLLFLYSPTH
jgi:hypothetical protein